MKLEHLKRASMLVVLVVAIILLFSRSQSRRGPQAAMEGEAASSAADEMVQLAVPPLETVLDSVQSIEQARASIGGKPTGGILLRLQATPEQLAGLRLELHPMGSSRIQTRNEAPPVASLDVERGEWLWLGLGPGSYRWRPVSGHALQVIPKNIEAEPTFTQDGRVLPPQFGPLMSGLIDVEAGRITEVVVPARSAGSLRGRVLFAGIAPGDIEVRLSISTKYTSPLTQRTGFSTRSSEGSIALAPDGSFHLPWISAGERQLQAQHRSDGRIILAGRAFELVEGQDLDLGLIEPNGNILKVRARLVDHEGKPFIPAEHLPPDVRIDALRPLLDVRSHAASASRLPCDADGQFVIAGLEPHGPGTANPLHSIQLTCTWDVELSRPVVRNKTKVDRDYEPSWSVEQRRYTLHENVSGLLEIDSTVREGRTISFDPDTFFPGRKVEAIWMQRLEPAPAGEDVTRHDGVTTGQTSSSDGVASLIVPYRLPGPHVVYAYSTPDDEGQRLCALFEVDGAEGRLPPPVNLPSSKVMVAIAPNNGRHARRAWVSVVTQHGAIALSWRHYLRALDDTPQAVPCVPPGARVWVGDAELHLGSATQVVPCDTLRPKVHKLAEPVLKPL